MSEPTSGDKRNATTWSEIPTAHQEAVEYLTKKYGIAEGIIGTVTKEENNVIALDRHTDKVPNRTVRLALPPAPNLISEARFGGNEGFEIPSVAKFLQNLHELDKNIEAKCEGKQIEPVFTLSYNAPDDQTPRVILLYRFLSGSESLQSSMVPMAYDVDRQLLLEDDFREAPIDPVGLAFRGDAREWDRDSVVWTPIGRSDLRIQMTLNEAGNTSYPSRFGVFIPSQKGGSWATVLDHAGNGPYPWQTITTLGSGPGAWS